MTGYVRGVQVDRSMGVALERFNSVVVKAYFPGSDIEITGSMRNAPAPSIIDVVRWNDGDEHALIDVDCREIAVLQMKVIQVVDRFSEQEQESSHVSGRRIVVA